MPRNEILPVLQPSKDNLYTKTSTREETGKRTDCRASSGGGGQRLFMDPSDACSHSNEPLQERTTKLKSHAMPNEFNQSSSVMAVITPDGDPSQELQIQQNQSFQPMNSFSLPTVDSCDRKSLSTDPQQKYSAGFKSSVLVSEFDQGDNVTSLVTAQCVEIPPGNDSSTVLPIQPNVPPHEILNIFSLPKKDTNPRSSESEVPLEEPKVDQQFASKTQAFCIITSGVAHNAKGHVLFDCRYDSCSKDHRKTQRQDSEVVAHVNKWQQQLNRQNELQKKLVMPLEQAAEKLVPLIPPIQPAPVMSNVINLSVPPSDKHLPPKDEASEDLPTQAQLLDYNAVTPRTFPHTCSLCLTECAHMTDWVIHLSTTHHEISCKGLRKRSPISLSSKDVKPLHHKTRLETSSSSHSSIPCHRHDSFGRGRRDCSQSASPYRSRRTLSRSDSDRPASSRYRSRSKSHERRSSLSRRDEKQSLQKRSHERHSSPWRRDEKRVSPRRSSKRRSSKERSHRQEKKLSRSEKVAKELLERPGEKRGGDKETIRQTDGHTVSGKTAVQHLRNQTDKKQAANTLTSELIKVKTLPFSSAATKSSSSTSLSQAKPSLKKNDASSSAVPRDGKVTCLFCHTSLADVKYLWDINGTLWCPNCCPGPTTIPPAFLDGLFSREERIPIPPIPPEVRGSIQTTGKLLHDSLNQGHRPEWKPIRYSNGFYYPLYRKVWELPDGFMVFSTHLTHNDAWVAYIQAAPAQPQASDNMYRETMDALSQLTQALGEEPAPPQSMGSRSSLAQVSAKTMTSTPGVVGLPAASPQVDQPSSTQLTSPDGQPPTPGDPGDDLLIIDEAVDEPPETPLQGANTASSHRHHTSPAAHHNSTPREDVLSLTTEDEGTLIELTPQVQKSENHQNRPTKGCSNTPRHDPNHRRRQEGGRPSPSHRYTPYGRKMGNSAAHHNRLQRSTQGNQQNERNYQKAQNPAFRKDGNRQHW
ncbi:uncharacterized protein KZ484_020097 [Pholidichthys leucotaenia]